MTMSQSLQAAVDPSCWKEIISQTMVSNDQTSSAGEKTNRLQIG